MIIITGQTATGKTKLALELAKKILQTGGRSELVNFDSRQIYKYLDIITGKDISKTKIWFYDIVTPDQYFSSFDFVKKVTPIIEDIKNRGKIPILVGGTYLYLKHLLYGIDYNNSPPDFKLRDKLNSKSVKELQHILTKINVQSINRLNNSDRNNPRRLIRRIEIANYQQKKIQKPSIIPISLYSPTDQFIGLKHMNKNKLHQAIIKRVKKRLKKGAIKEVEKLLKMGYKKSDPGLKTIGYQQIIKYLNKESTQERAIEDWINKEIQYAKRQYTFMKKDKNIDWKEI
jgi:tRNA dimethylallyltransferase